MTQISTAAGIDTSKAKLDIAVHGRVEHWQVENTLVGWRRWWRRRVAQRGSATYRVIDSDRQILQHLR